MKRRVKGLHSLSELKDHSEWFCRVRAEYGIIQWTDYFSCIFAWAKRMLKKVKEWPRERESIFKKVTVMSFFSIR